MTEKLNKNQDNTTDLTNVVLHQIRKLEPIEIKHSIQLSRENIASGVSFPPFS